MEGFTLEVMKVDYRHETMGIFNQRSLLVTNERLLYVSGNPLRAKKVAYNESFNIFSAI